MNENYEIKKIVEKQCQYPDCDKTFIPRNNRQKYCEEHSKNIKYSQKVNELAEKWTQNENKNEINVDKITNIVIRSSGGLEISIKIT